MERWTDDDSMLSFFQAAREISEKSIQPAAVSAIAHAALNAWLRENDPHASFLSPAENKAVKAAREPTYGGVGMELTRAADGKLLCLPYPDSPAERAGIREGDRLYAVDGQIISANEALPVTGARIRGPVDTHVHLMLKRTGSPQLELTIRRARVQSHTVIPAGVNLWRILYFDSSTADELHTAISSAATEPHVILDLRGNSGGSLAAAIEAARLFLPEESEIVEIHTRMNKTSHKGRAGAPFTTLPFVFLWQDHRTASAAEVFIAALGNNARAMTVGEITFGKGTTQRSSELVNGSALIFTDGRLIGPKGLEYDGTGLIPDIPVARNDTAAYQEATRHFVEAALATFASPPLSP